MGAFALGFRIAVCHDGQACLSSSVGIAYMATDGTIQEANQAFGDLVGLCVLCTRARGARVALSAHTRLRAFSCLRACAAGPTQEDG